MGGNMNWDMLVRERSVNASTPLLSIPCGDIRLRIGDSSYVPVIDIGMAWVKSKPSIVLAVKVEILQASATGARF